MNHRPLVLLFMLLWVAGALSGCVKRGLPITGFPEPDVSPADRTFNLVIRIEEMDVSNDGKDDKQSQLSQANSRLQEAEARAAENRERARLRNLQNQNKGLRAQAGGAALNALDATADTLILQQQQQEVAQTAMQLSRYDMGLQRLFASRFNQEFQKLRLFRKVAYRTPDSQVTLQTTIECADPADGLSSLLWELGGALYLPFWLLGSPGNWADGSASITVRAVITNTGEEVMSWTSSKVKRGHAGLYYRQWPAGLAMREAVTDVLQQIKEDADTLTRLAQEKGAAPNATTEAVAYPDVSVPASTPAQEPTLAPIPTPLAPAVPTSENVPAQEPALVTIPLPVAPPISEPTPQATPLQVLPSEAIPVSEPTRELSVSTKYPMNPIKKAGFATFFPGLGVAAFGGVAMWRAASAKDSIKRTGDWGKDSTRKTWRALSITGYTVGGAAMLTGIILWFVSPGDKEWWEAHHPSTAIGPVRDGAVISLNGRW